MIEAAEEPLQYAGYFFKALVARRVLHALITHASVLEPPDTWA